MEYRERLVLKNSGARLWIMGRGVGIFVGVGEIL